MFERYKIKKDDTLYSIAKKFNTKIDYLKNINDIYFLDSLREGMDIVVPIKKEKYYDIVKSEKQGSLLSIAESLNINPNLFANLNGLELNDYIYKNQEILIPKTNYSYYIVAEGDTLNSIANTFGVSKDRILSQNEIIYLLPEQVIINKKIKKI